MSFDSLLTLTATITHRAQTGAADRYNVATWEETSTTGVPCYREQLTATENTVARELQEATHRVMFKPGVVLDGSDIVTIQGVSYEVVGPPSQGWNPRTATLHHIEANLKELSE